MDMGTFRGLLTLVLMVLFVALVLWAYSKKRREDFAAAARLPLHDDPLPFADPRCDADRSPDVRALENRVVMLSARSRGERRTSRKH